MSKTNTAVLEQDIESGINEPIASPEKSPTWELRRADSMIRGGSQGAFAGILTLELHRNGIDKASITLDHTDGLMHRLRETAAYAKFAALSEVVSERRTALEQVETDIAAAAQEMRTLQGAIESEGGVDALRELMTRQTELGKLQEELAWELKVVELSLEEARRGLRDVCIAVLAKFKTDVSERCRQDLLSAKEALVNAIAEHCDAVHLAARAVPKIANWNPSPDELLQRLEAQE